MNALLANKFVGVTGGAGLLGKEFCYAVASHGGHAGVSAFGRWHAIVYPPPPPPLLQGQ